MTIKDDPVTTIGPLTREIDPVEPDTFLPPAGERTHDADDARPWVDLKTTGLLWLINATVFHPRGYALGLFRDLVTGEYTGWMLLGDGREPWVMTDDGLPEGEPTIDDLFRAAKELMS